MFLVYALTNIIYLRVAFGLWPDTRGDTVTGTREDNRLSMRLVTLIALLFNRLMKGRYMVNQNVVDESIFDDIRQVITESIDESVSLHDEAGDRVSSLQDSMTTLSDIQTSLEDSQNAIENAYSALSDLREVGDDLDTLGVTI